jgi:short-subunit dehydrogenase
MQAAAEETIVITGASSGIGREIALKLSGPGRRMWMVGRDQERLEAVAAQSRSKGATVTTVALDLTDLESAKRFLDGTFPEDVRVDQIYLAAAVSLFGEVKDMHPEDWNRIYLTNLLSPVQWMRHFYAGMVKRRAGRIILISSLAAYAGYPTATAYATSKAGLLGLYRSMWHEGRAHGVAFHIASPGYVDTRIYQSAVFRGTTYEKIMAQTKRLGFTMLPAPDAAARILRAIEKGRGEFSLPAYATVLRWLSNRIPSLINLIHAKVIKQFREAS